MGVFGLEYAFRACHKAMPHAREQMTIGALPAAALMYQCEVVNRYRHAATHYLPVSLEEPYLRSTSFASPREKWATFTEADFANLSWAVVCLMSLTLGLLHQKWKVAESVTDDDRDLRRAISIVRGQRAAVLPNMLQIRHGELVVVELCKKRNAESPSDHVGAYWRHKAVRTSEPGSASELSRRMIVEVERLSEVVMTSRELCRVLYGSDHPVLLNTFDGVIEGSEFPGGIGSARRRPSLKEEG